MSLDRICEVEVDAAALWREHPPRFTNERKRELIVRVAEPIGETIAVSRWSRPPNRL